MKNIFLIFAFSLLTTALYSSNNANSLAVTAYIKGLGDDTLYVSHYSLRGLIDNDVEMLMDTVIAYNNQFQFNLPVNENTSVLIRSKKLLDNFGRRSVGVIHLVLEPNKPLDIMGQIEDDGYLSYRVKQEGYSADYAVNRENHKTLELEEDRNYEAREFLYNLPREEFQKYRDSLQKKLKKLSDEHDKLRQIRKDLYLSYIRNNLDKDLSASYLGFASSRDIDTFGVYYPLLAESVKQGMFKEVLDFMLEEYQFVKLTRQAAERTAEGTTAPDFTLSDLAGESVSLSNLKENKYIVLYFWASWCAPCIKGFPTMKTFYNTHKSRVEFVGIAVNDKDDAWRNAVEKYELNWVQLRDESKVTEGVPVRYGVSTVPTKIILDKDLKIVARFEGSDDDFYEKLNELLK
jgi:thiol-disulfide isomerase/thioredoxin